MKTNLPGNPMTVSVDQDFPEPEMTDEDILDAMRHIAGYLDITTEDFRAIYHLAHRHAMDRLFGGISAARLMRTGVATLRPDMPMDEAAQVIVRSGYKSLPVADAGGCVIGMLTETDFLRSLEADTFLDLWLKIVRGEFALAHRFHEIPVSEGMTTPAVCVAGTAGVLDIMRAFARHAGRAMPVVDSDGRLQGMLLRKDFIAAYNPADGR
ncbi:MAG: CBS domain-containing protein [Proteobacteria bacterium]|nr:CBS domain-containing protein [Pseudomonadota bacterium]